MEELLTRMNAKLVVQEMLLCQLLITLSKTLPGNVEFIRAVMMAVEEQLTQSHRSAPLDKRQMAEATRQYFEELTAVMLHKLPAGSKH